MKTAKPAAKKKAAPAKAVSLSSLSARILGRCRILELDSVAAHRLALEFPMLTAGELDSVFGELLDKNLLVEAAHESYSLTPHGKAARITIS